MLLGTQGGFTRKASEACTLTETKETNQRCTNGTALQGLKIFYTLLCPSKTISFLSHSEGLWIGTRQKRAMGCNNLFFKNQVESASSPKLLDFGEICLQAHLWGEIKSIEKKKKKKASGPCHPFTSNGCKSLASSDLWQLVHARI